MMPPPSVLVVGRISAAATSCRPALVVAPAGFRLPTPAVVATGPAGPPYWQDDAVLLVLGSWDVGPA